MWLSLFDALIFMMLSQPEKYSAQKKQPAKEKDRRVATVRYSSQRRERKRSK
jgi:hypothetical protein